jgi:hypothetical protein
MAATVLEMKDISRLLVVPSRKKPVSQTEMAAFNARLAPIEMSAPTVHLAGCLQKTPAAKQELAEPLISASTHREGVHIPCWVLPGAYAACGLILLMCTLLVPDLIVPCVHVLSPVWSVALLLHALADGEPAWAWLGCLTGALLPFVLLVREPLFVCFYLAVFAAFASGRFWRTLHGPAFVLVCVCLFGLATACVLSVLADHPRAQLSVAALFALGAGIVSSAARFGKLHLSVA